jgi:hypothetical protein
MCCKRLAPMRFVPLSYFCTCWNVSPRPSASFSWLIPSIFRAIRTRLPTCLSTGLGAFLTIACSRFTSACGADCAVRAVIGSGTSGTRAQRLDKQTPASDGSLSGRAHALLSFLSLRPVSVLSLRPGSFASLRPVSFLSLRPGGGLKLAKLSLEDLG